ncbi:hypothetical protein ACWDSJ_24735 [Nocardia sp. NPDC003482]
MSDGPDEPNPHPQYEFEVSIDAPTPEGFPVVRVAATGPVEVRAFFGWVMSRLSEPVNGTEAVDPVRLAGDPATARLVAAADARLADMWRTISEKYGMLTATEVASVAHRSEAAVQDYLDELVRDGGLLRLAEPAGDGAGVFPGFQFDVDGTVPPVVSRLIARLTAEWDAREVVLWMASPNGWLGGHAPADLLLTRPDSVLLAADYAVAAE